MSDSVLGSSPTWVAQLCLVVPSIAAPGPQSTAAAIERAVPVDFTGPDFSFAGRDSRAAEPPLVDRTTHGYFDVTDFGAVPNDRRSDRVAVEAAIAAAEAHPGPSVVWFPPGRFVLRGQEEVGAAPIRVRRDEIVLKGAGRFSGETELFIASESVDQPALLFWPELDPNVSWRGAATLTALTEAPARGTREVRVADTSGIQAGDIVRLSAALPDSFNEFRAFFGPLDEEELIEEYFNQSAGIGADWRCDFLSTLEVESVGEDYVRFKDPLYADYPFTSPTFALGPRLVQIFAEGDALLTQSGVEDLAFVSNFRDNFKHFFNRAADGYNFLEMRDVRECWVRRVRMRSGTRGITFSNNGRSNVVYDVLFEGNSGHYSITAAGNIYGNQASFLCESTPVHHGFGATSSAFGTVYHRCNQFGGPEGHGGYPQATLYDCNEGDLSLVRIGGAPPHQSKGTVFWNWNQSLLVPSNAGLHVGGRYRARTLNGAQIDFWPHLIMRPFVIGLTGVPLDILDTDADLQPLRRLDGPVLPESLFESQLRVRLGAVPEWLHKRARSFETVTRVTQVDIADPLGDTRATAGEPLEITVRLHPRFDRTHLRRVELLAARGHDLDESESVVAESAERDVETLSWHAPAGPWRLRLRLVNTLSEEAVSEPIYAFVEPAENDVELAAPIAGWLQPRSLDGRSIMQASSEVVYEDPHTYHNAVRAIERPLIEDAVHAPDHQAVGEALIDGNLSHNATGPAGLRWFGNKGLVIDLGERQRVDFIELVGSPGAENRQYFGAFDVQVSTDNDAQYAYTNSDFTWRTVRRMGHARSSARMPMSADRRYRIYFPAGTYARFVRLSVRLLDSRGQTEGNLAEILVGRYPALDR